MRNIIMLGLMLAISAAISFPALGDTVFSSDFQGQKIDEAPAKWVNVVPGQAGTTGVIAEDPQDANNNDYEDNGSGRTQCACGGDG